MVKKNCECEPVPSVRTSQMFTSFLSLNFVLIYSVKFLGCHFFAFYFYQYVHFCVSFNVYIASFELSNDQKKMNIHALFRLNIDDNNENTQTSERKKKIQNFINLKKVQSFFSYFYDFACTILLKSQIVPHTSTEKCTKLFYCCLCFFFVFSEMGEKYVFFLSLSSNCFNEWKLMCREPNKKKLESFSVFFFSAHSIRTIFLMAMEFTAE